MELKNLLGVKDDESFEVVTASDIESQNYKDMDEEQMLEEINRDFIGANS